MNKPSIGRALHYWPSDHDRSSMPGMVVNDMNKPMAALVTYVWTDNMVNLAVFDHNGQPFGKTSVRLLDENEVSVAGSGVATWPARVEPKKGATK